MNQRKTITATVLIASILIGVSPFAVEATSLNQRQAQYKTNVTFVENDDLNTTGVGVNADSNLYFGRTVVGTGFTKWVKISVEKFSEIRIETSGNISRVLDYNSRTYMNTSKEISLKAGTENPGYYEGKLKITVKTPKNNVGKTWLEIKRALFKGTA